MSTEYEAIKEPVVPKADPELVKSYDGMRVPKNHRAIVLALRSHVIKNIDRAYELWKLCSCEDPYMDGCPACETRHSHLQDAAINTVRMFKVQAYQMPWELITDALAYCMEKELDND